METVATTMDTEQKRRNDLKIEIELYLFRTQLPTTISMIPLYSFQSSTYINGPCGPYLFLSALTKLILVYCQHVYGASPSLFMESELY